MTRVAASADLRACSGAMSFYFDCIPKEDAVQDIAASLQQYLHDLMDIRRAIDATHRRQFVRAAIGHVKELEDLGAVVTIGRRNGRMKIGEHDSMPWNCVHLVVSYKNDVKETVLVPKDGRPTFG